MLDTVKRLSVVIGVSLLGSPPCPAGVLRVPEDYPSVLAAVDAAASGDSVLIGPGSWTDKEARVVLIGGIAKTFTSCGFLKGGVTVVGVGVDATIIDAGASGSGFVTPFVFANYPGEEATLEGLSIAGTANFGTGAFADNAGRLVIRACRLNGMTNPGPQGAALALDRCDLLLEDSEVSFNVSSATAGVYAHECDIQILRCRFEGNQGRAVELSTSASPNSYTVVIQDCGFIGNRMTISGAAVSLGDPLSVQVERNLFLRNVNTTSMGAGLLVNDALGSIRYNTFAYDSTLWGASGLYLSNFGGEVSNNTFVGCHVDAPGAGSALSAGSTGIYVTQFHHNLIADCTGSGSTVFSNILQTITGTCNAFWKNEGGLGDYVPSSTDLFLDPLFCDVPNLDFTLQENSPYAAGNNATCGQIGAFGVGCGGVAVESVSWGRLKTLYR
jgi:hypothetical protein